MIAGAGLALTSVISCAPPADASQTEQARAAAEAKAAADSAAAAAGDALAAANAAMADVESKAEAVPSNWSYNETADEMRGTKTRFASATANNSLNLGFPYDGGHARLTLRQRPEDGLNVFLSIDGQFICSEYSGDTVAVKFDDGPIQTYRCAEPAAGGTGLLFINGEKRFVENLRKAKKVIIEAPFYDNGRQQMTFDVAGLDW